MDINFPPPPRKPITGLVAVVALVTGALLGPATVGHPAVGPAAHVVPARAAPPVTRASAPIPIAELDRFAWPLPPPHPVLRPFQQPATPYGPGHRGVDLGGSAGEAVLAAGDGLVRYAGPLADRSLVSIEHPGGLRTTYEPVQPLVAVGQQVRRGQPIGELLAGHPGCPAGQVCLHWGVHRGRYYLDPLRLVVGQIRLLPWPADLVEPP
jgi:murein DD-endopeptidase MepM/ murein hydrolase activator NlpD